MTRRSAIGLSGVVLLLLVGGLALREPSRLVASAFYSAASATMAVALVAIPHRRGRDRASYAGFVILGGTYLLLTTCPILDTHVGVHLLPTAGLDLLYAKFTHRPPSTGPFSYDAWSDWTDTDLNFNRRYVGSVVLVASESFMRIGNSLAAILLGLIGARLARLLAVTASPRT